LILAILAAGSSQRFGGQNKLAANLDGKMLGLHAAEALADGRFREKVIVTTSAHPCSSMWEKLGFHLLINERAQDGQATSVKMAAAYARKTGAEALCICLADMPFVNADLMEQLLAEYRNLEGAKIVACSNGKQPQPPAIFPAVYFDQLAGLAGDQGARKLLSEARVIGVNERILMDIDSAKDLRRAEALYDE